MEFKESPFGKIPVDWEIKKISEVSSCKIVVVGDDFQTIYSFSGSNINLFVAKRNNFQ